MELSSEIKLNMELVERYGCANVTGSVGEDSVQVMLENGYEIQRAGGEYVGYQDILIERVS